MSNFFETMEDLRELSENIKLYYGREKQNFNEKDFEEIHDELTCIINDMKMVKQSCKMQFKRRL